MTLAQIQEKALELSPWERSRLAEVIWNSLDAEPDAFQITDAQREVLDRRLSESLAHPEDALTWPEVKARLEEG